MKKCSVCEREISEEEYKNKIDEIGETDYGDVICPECMKGIDDEFVKNEENQENEEAGDENDEGSN